MPGIFFVWGHGLIIDSKLLIELNIFSCIFSKEVSMYKFIYKLISVRYIALEKVFVQQSFQNFIFKQDYRCAPFQIKRKVIPNL